MVGHPPGCGCGEFYVHGDVDGGEVYLRTNLRGHPFAPDIARALSAHLGASEQLVKADDPTTNRDWKYPDLDVLIMKARRDWVRWGLDLVKAIERLYADGKLYPLTPEREAVLQGLFADHQAWLTVRFTGLRDLLPAPKDADGYQAPSHIEAAYRLGKGLDMLDAALHYRADAPGAEPRTTEDVLRAALEIPLTAQDVHAMQYAQRRAGIYMSRPGTALRDEITRTLSAEERHVAEETNTKAAQGKGPAATPGGLTEAQSAVIQAATETAVAERMSTTTFARRLRDLADATLTNDMDRVARTELRFAHAYGAYRKLKDQAAEAGSTDPLVYKLTSMTACAHCVRIWGRKGSIRYRLSEIEAWERDDGNFKKKASQWRATIGPIHPNCTCGTLLLYTGDDLHQQMLAAVDGMLAAWRKEVAEPVRFNPDRNVADVITPRPPRTPRGASP